MARYIDADKAKQEFNIGFGGVSHAVIANQIIDSIPTADVAEVKHAHWIKTPCSERDGDANCSYCGNWDWSDKNYCSNCGARMELKEKCN